MKFIHTPAIQHEVNMQVRIEPNDDGSYTAWFFGESHNGSESECCAWLDAQSKSVEIVGEVRSPQLPTGRTE